MQVKYLFQDTGRKQLVMYAVFALSGVAMFYAITRVSVHAPYGALTVALATLALSWTVAPVGTTYLMKSRWLGHRSWYETLAPSNHSWAYLFGDALLLAPALALSAYAWHGHGERIPRSFHEWYWVPLCGLLAILFGFAFRTKENPRYHISELREPFKVFHDWVVVPLLFGALMARAFPLLFAWSAITGCVLALVIGWAILAQIDDWRGRLPKGHPLRLVASRQHHRWNARRFAPACAF